MLQAGVRGGGADLVHAPLAHWAAMRPHALAIADGTQTLTFAQLNAAVQQRASVLTQTMAPATVFVNERLSTLEQAVDFLGIIASGRCAAVGDPDWPAALRQAVRASISQHPASVEPPQPDSPFYIGFTSGSTGIPKGFRRHHRSWTESFQVCVDEFGPVAARRVLAPGRFSHSLFLFGMMLGIWSGAGVAVQAQFSAARALDALQGGCAPCLVAVPGQLIMMMELAAHRVLAPIDSVELILISGARWMRQRTPELKALFPRARIIEFYGASETSFIAWMEADADTPPQVVGRAFGNVQIDIRNGLIFVRSPMLFMDYVGANVDTTACIREGEWLSVRDMGSVDETGRLCLAGRQSRMIITQAKKLFPEELESVLETCPQIARASVHGVPDPVRGQQVVAVIELSPSAAQNRPTTAQLTQWCRTHLEAFKAPKRYWVCTDWRLTASGKTDHHTLGQALLHHMDIPNPSLPCLYPLP